MFEANELKIWFANVVVTVGVVIIGWLTNETFVVSIPVKEPASTLAAAPPPVRYLTVKVVLYGAIP